MKLNLFCYSIFEVEVRVGGGRGDGVIGEGGMVKEGGGKGMRGGNGEGRVWGGGEGRRGKGEPLPDKLVLLTLLKGNECGQLIKSSGDGLLYKCHFQEMSWK